jgi:hypothetical protein
MNKPGNVGAPSIGQSAKKHSPFVYAIEFGGFVAFPT